MWKTNCRIQSLPNFRRNGKFPAFCPMRRNWALGWERNTYWTLGRKLGEISVLGLCWKIVLKTFEQPLPGLKY